MDNEQNKNMYPFVSLVKKIYTPSHHKQHALEHLHRKGPHHAIYTDGSKSPTGVGCAAVFLNNINKMSLPISTSVFTSELTAILLATYMI